MSATFRGHALIVSVDRNADDRLQDLGPSVQADGDLIQRILLDEDVCGYGPTRLQRLAGEQATASSIANALHQLSITADPLDPVFFYFSGHGDATSCDGSEGASLFPWDADLDRCRNVLSTGLIAGAWNRILSRRKLAVVDACFSGGLAITKSGAPLTKQLSRHQLSALAQGEGSVLISSSRSTEPSLILGGDNVSLFTKHLANGLLGHAGHDQDGFVRVFDLFNYVAKNVRHDSPRQSPVYAAYHQDQNFAVAFCSKITSRKTPTAPMHIDSDHARLQAALSLFVSLYPLGPTDQAIWERAGGDLAQLTLLGQGRADWFRAIQFITRGGGSLTIDTLCREALSDYPRNRDLEYLLSSS